MTRLLLKTRFTKLGEDNLPSVKYIDMIINFDYVTSIIEYNTDLVTSQSCTPYSVINITEHNTPRSYVVDLPVKEVWDALERIEAKRK